MGSIPDILISRGKPPLNPLLSKEGKWGGKKLKSFPLLLINNLHISVYSKFFIIIAGNL